MSQRIQKVNELLRREISSAIGRDLEFPDALVTVNSVEVTPDLRQGTVYVGLIGEPRACRNALELIEKRRGHIQNKVAARVVLRYFPKLTFKADNSVERGTDILNLLEEVDRLPTAPLEELEADCDANGETPPN
jgi:ribosome-binding factor A